MKVVGLITEYNPFHNGHKYHIEEAKRVTGADYCIAVMSGNFVQRGTPAVIDKYSRTEMALRNGIDLVFELPVCYATGSAEYFAHGAIALLDKLGIVDTLCFGSECGTIEPLQKAADFLLHTPKYYDQQLQAFLKKGLTYPAARLKAFEYFLGQDETVPNKELAEILKEPNNILGIEYVKALKRISSTITPITIQRIAAHYHDPNLSVTSPDAPVDGASFIDIYDATLSSDMNTGDELIISSATAIRRAIFQPTEDITSTLRIASQSVPMDVAKYLIQQYQKTYPITEEDFIDIIKYKLMSESKQALTAYMDVTEDLADRITNITDLNHNLSDLIKMIKTKNITLTRVNRALIHLLLNIKTNAVNDYIQSGYIPYARVLGTKKESTHLLRSIEKAGNIPIITKVSKASSILSPIGQQMLEEDIFASHIYNQAIYHKYNTIIPNEFKHGIILI